MTETPDTPQYREPGVRYRKVTRYRTRRPSSTA